MKNYDERWKEVKCEIAYEKQMEWEKWSEEIPVLQFPAEWKIQIIPPCGGAVVRFRVKQGTADINIYLDCYDRRAYIGEPYWEVFPHNGKKYRCGIKQTDLLLKAIQESIDETMINANTDIKLITAGE